MVGKFLDSPHQLLTYNQNTVFVAVCNKIMCIYWNAFNIFKCTILMPIYIDCHNQYIECMCFLLRYHNHACIRVCFTLVTNSSCYFSSNSIFVIKCYLSIKRFKRFRITYVDTFFERSTSRPNDAKAPFSTYKYAKSSISSR